MSDAVSTRYPLLLVPGLLGFVRLLGYPYWYGIESRLRALGVRVVAVRVSPLHANEVRGEQLLACIEAVLKETGAAKVNLVGHSQGALTARYAAALRPDLVASVTSVSGPNHGSELADFCLRKAPPGSWREALFVFAMASAARWIGWLETGARGPALPRDARACAVSLSGEGMRGFNARYPQGVPEVWGGEGAEVVNGVRYYSWSGTLQPGKTARGGNWLDGSNLVCRLLARTFIREAGQTDGMVGRCSSHLGRVIGDQYPLDHFDSVNQMFGLVGAGARPVELFVEHARRLGEAGL